MVRGANWVGDAVMTVPALRALRRVLPNARITLATRRWAEGIFADAPDLVDDLLIIDDQTKGVRAFVAQVAAWRARRFDLAVLFPNAFAPALVAAAARVPLRLGYATDGRRLLLTHPLEAPTWRAERHEVFYYLNLVAGLEQALTGAREIMDATPQFALSVAPARQDEAREILLSHGAQTDRPLVALCPGSTNSRAKRWPSAAYAALADQLVEVAGVCIVIIGAREELDITNEVVGQMRMRPVVFTGETTLAQSVAILSLVDLLVTNDTGPAHVAAALSRPTLVIFGPTNPLTTRPFSPTAEVVRRVPDCAPCMLRDCPIDHRCMTAITPEEVYARAVSLLEQSAGVAPAYEVAGR